MSPRVHRSSTQRSDHSSSSGSSYSDSSDHARSTAPTIHSVRPGLKHHGTTDGRLEFEEECYFERYEDPRVSTETYASTLPSTEDLPEEPQYAVPEGRHEVYASEAIPATPPEFAKLFPSCRTLYIRHDDATVDGNMNLRVETEVPSEGGTDTIILYHLKMQDLKTRKFSLRRYCRESGREVCHSSRKYMLAAEQKRPGLQRSLSHALSSITSLRSKSDTASPTFSLKRQDSGYDSDDEKDEFGSSSQRKSSTLPMPTNTIQMEFSNYAHVDVKRRGAKASKRYECEYWGNSYVWRREVVRTGWSKEVSFHLINTTTSKPVAHIVPLRLNLAEARAEDDTGGWIPPCSMWISDPSITKRLTDVGDVIVATGLVAFVDDCIKRRFHSKRSVQLALPALPGKSLHLENSETSAPKRFIEEAFGGRRGTTATQRPDYPRQATTG